MKNSVYSKVLFAAAVSVICACVLLETAALLFGQKDTVTTAAYAESDIYNISSEEEAFLTNFVHAAAGDAPFICKVSVAAVVFNRIKSSEYPFSVREIISSDKAFKALNENSDADPKGLYSASNAVHQAMNGEDPTNGALHFYRSDSDEHMGEVTFRAAGMVFTR